MSIQVFTCFLGPPASGKGTFATRFIPKHGGQIVTPGNIYKVLRQEDSPLGHRVREALQDGGLCPDDLTNEIVLAESNRLIQEGAKGIGLDGYPRSLVQFAFLKKHYTVSAYLHFESDYSLLLKTAISRRECAECGTVFNLRDMVGTWCRCGEAGAGDEVDIVKWKRRWDDTEELYEKRFVTYLKKTEPMIAEIMQEPNYIRYDALQATQESLRELESRLALLLPRSVEPAPSHPEPTG